MLQKVLMGVVQFYAILAILMFTTGFLVGGWLALSGQGLDALLPLLTSG